MFTEQKLLRRRRVYCHNLDKWQRSYPRNVGENERENMKEGKPCGKVMVWVISYFICCQTHSESFKRKSQALVPQWMADLDQKGGDIPGMDTDVKEKVERDTRWVGEWSDNLAVAIALKEWTEAVDLVEQGQLFYSVDVLSAHFWSRSNQTSINTSSCWQAAKFDKAIDFLSTYLFVITLKPKIERCVTHYSSKSS